MINLNDVNIEQIHKIRPRFNSGGTHLVIDISLCDRDTEDLFYQLWSEVGTERLEAWLKAERYKLEVL
jgi:hypothetical protein